MPAATDALDAERRFFAALLAGDAAALGEVLTDDFLLIDVMSGSEVPGAVLRDLVGSGQLVFDAIEPAETRVRRYGAAAVVTGRTRMRLRFGETALETQSRYTHVFVQQDAAWRLASAQGTRIADTPTP
jgi:ketosteroid isomerase-like protein